MSKQEKLTGADYLLLMLYLNDRKPIKSAVRLIKMMFLFKKEIAPLLKKKGAEINKDTLPNFQPYNYGPFSKEVYEQIELFKSIGFIKVQDLNASEEMDEVDDWEEKPFIDELTEQSIGYENRHDGKFMQYKLLKSGTDYVQSEIEPLLTEDQIKVLMDFKDRINQTPIKAILRYVYIKYPAMTKKSLIKDEVLES